MRLSLRQLLASSIGKELDTQNSVLRIIPVPAEECDDRKEKTINVLDESGLVKSLFHQIDNCTWGIRVDAGFLEDLIEQLDSTFANENLTFDEDRIHDLNEHALRLGNGHFELDNHGDTYRWQIATNLSGGLLFLVTEVSSGKEVGFEVRPGALGIQLHTGQTIPTFGEYYVKLDHNGNILKYEKLKVQEYSNHAHADSSAEPGEIYRITGVNQIFVKDGGTVPAPENIYNTDGSLPESRTVNLDGNTLSFDVFGDNSVRFLLSSSSFEWRFGNTYIQVTSGGIKARSLNNLISIYTKKNVVLQLKGADGAADWEPITVPEYDTDMDADSDSNLPSGGMYALTGDRSVKRKP